MATERINDILMLVREKLQTDGVKLWLPPYHDEVLGSNEEQIAILASSFSSALAIPANRCRMALVELQQHAIEKRRANIAFSQQGIATIKVRAPVNSDSQTGARYLTVNTALSVTGRDFQIMIAERLDQDPSNLRVINAGKFVHEDDTLESQGIRNHHQVMVVAMSAPPAASDAPQASTSAGAAAASAASENIYQRVARARADAQLLSTSNGGASNFISMEDQAGNAVHLPPDENQAIVVALALHEKGKIAMRRGNFNEALVWFLEADDEYKRCNSVLLQSVDNWALLNLDVVWCYFCLQSVAQLPEASARLSICEQSFKRTYGPELDRVVALKGNAVNEKALIMRLHLMQAVILFHQQRRMESAELLLKVEGELNRLRVSDASLTALVEMGYTAREARLSLRACDGSIDQAVGYIIAQREERRKSRQKSRNEMNLRVGRSKDETWVNPRSLRSLMDMGFEKGLCEVALRKCDNDLPRALTMLQQDSAELRRLYNEDFVVDRRIVDSLIAMGFPPAIADACARSTDNRLDEAVDVAMRLTQQGGEQSELFQELLRNVQSESSSAEARQAAMRVTDDLERSEREHQDANEAFERFAEDFDDDLDDDHLDLPLDQEAKVLAEYKRYLNL